MYRHVVTAIAAAILLTSGAAMSQTRPANGSQLEYQTSQSDLVFKGTVTAIRYRNSNEGIPHTFVTYRVDNVLKGVYGPKTITLRFIGGVERQGTIERTLVASNAPSFSNGQQDLLMVKSNGESTCPLVQCAQGRFRLEQGRVKTEVGSVIAKRGNGAAVVLSGANARIASGGNAVKLAEGDIATPYSQAEFVALVRGVIARQGTAAAKTKAIQSMDPGKPFNGTLPTVSGPPVAR